MRDIFINLKSSETVQDFVNTIAGLNGDFELISGIYILDARSLLGIISLNRQQPVKLRIYNDFDENYNRLERFIVSDNVEKD